MREFVKMCESMKSRCDIQVCIQGLFCVVVVVVCVFFLSLFSRVCVSGECETLRTLACGCMFLKRKNKLQSAFLSERTLCVCLHLYGNRGERASASLFGVPCERSFDVCM